MPPWLHVCSSEQRSAHNILPKRPRTSTRSTSSLLKNSIAVKFRVELAFRPASKPFISRSESASADGTGDAERVFQQPARFPRRFPHHRNLAATAKLPQQGLRNCHRMRQKNSQIAQRSLRLVEDSKLPEDH